MACNSTPRHQIVQVLAIWLVSMLIAGAAGFWAGKRADAPSSALLTEQLHRQGKELARVGEVLDVLAQRHQAVEAECKQVDVPIADEQLQDAIDRSLKKSLDNQARAEELARETDAEPSEENLTAFAGGEQLVTSAVRSKQWTAAHAASFRQILGKVTPEQASSLLRELSTAINSGHLAVSPQGPPI